VSLASQLVRGESRAGALGLSEWASFFNYHGLAYPLSPNYSIGVNKQEEITAEFGSLVQQAYKQNGVVFACMAARMLLFSEARFQFRQVRSGRPGALFGNADLQLLEQPWTNGTTGALLARMEQDASLAGNFYARRAGMVLQRMRPDWVTIVLGSKRSQETAGWEIDAEVIGYAYHPGGRASGRDPEVFLPEEVVHYAPIPDPAARFRGMSWLGPVIQEIMGDSAASAHKLRFFENGATPNLVVKLDPAVNQENFNSWTALFEEKYGSGVMNAYKTMYLGGGADATVVGADLRQLDFKVVQGAGETRIAAAAGVPPVIVGLSEGLQAATYSNYSQARRRFADGTMRPLWREAAASLATVVNVPADAELWYDDRDIAFLQEDLADKADVQQKQATSIKTLVDAGYDVDSVVDAVTSDDLTRLKHSGLVSVQLQAPGADPTAGRSEHEPDPHLNGHLKEDLRV
jgi:phage portal protein BeeE